MNFLQIVKRTREKCGISGSGPVTVSGQSGELLRIVNWVNESWMEIQNKHTDWMWMRRAFSFETTLGQQDYTPVRAGATDFSHWHTDTLRAYRSGAGVNDEQWIHPMDYERFRDVYQYANRITGRPSFFSVRPGDLALLLGPIPTNDLMTVVGEYQKHATEMTADSDVPAMPSQFHMLIVYGAMERYAAFEAAPEVMVGVSKSYVELKTRLEINQLPQITAGGTLA